MVGAVLWTFLVALALDAAAARGEESSRLLLRVLRFLPLIALAGFVSAPVLESSILRSSTRFEDAALAVAWNVACGVSFSALVFVDACFSAAGTEGAASSVAAATSVLAAMVRTTLTLPFGAVMLQVFALIYLLIRWMRRPPSTSASEADASLRGDEHGLSGWPSSYSLTAFGTGCAWMLVFIAVTGGRPLRRAPTEELLQSGGMIVIFASCGGLASVLVAWLVEKHLWPGRSWRARISVGVALAALRFWLALPLLAAVMAMFYLAEPWAWIGWAVFSTFYLLPALVYLCVLGLGTDPWLVVGLATLVTILALAEASLLSAFAIDRSSRARSTRRGA